MVATPKPTAKPIVAPTSAEARPVAKPPRLAFADGLIHLRNQTKQGAGLMCPADPKHPDPKQRPEKILSSSVAFHREIAAARTTTPAEPVQGCIACVTADFARIKKANLKPFRRIATPRTGAPLPPTESARRR